METDWTSYKNHDNKIVFMVFSNHLFCLYVSMASAMGSWCAPLAPNMYWVTLETTSGFSWTGPDTEINIVAGKPAEDRFCMCYESVSLKIPPMTGASDLWNRSLQAVSWNKLLYR